MMRLFLILALGVVLGSGVKANDAPQLPRFVSLAKDEIFVRTGPALQYPIKWVYKKRGLPVEIIREYDTWRQVRDIDGSTGWVHHAMLTSTRNAIIQSKNGITLAARPETAGDPVVKLETGVVVNIDRCDPGWCRVEFPDSRDGPPGQRYGDFIHRKKSSKIIHRDPP
jgi:SH3-like domain-containing protein